MQKRIFLFFFIVIVACFTIGVNAKSAPQAIKTLSSTLEVSADDGENPNILSKHGFAVAEPGQIITYDIALNNPDTITHTFHLTDSLPLNTGFVTGSATPGLTYDTMNHRLTWTGPVGPGVLGYVATAVSPLTYLNLGDLPTPPANLCNQPSNCDEGTAVFDLAASGHSITFFDETVTTLNLSTNGLIYGPAGVSGAVCLACPQPLPHTTEPNQLIAGLWRDIDMSGGNGQWYAAIISGLLVNPADEVLYVNWHNAGQFGNPFLTSRHAIAIVLDGQSEPAGRIYVIVDHISDATALTSAGYAIGVENSSGTIGTTYAFAPCAELPCIRHGAIGTVPVDGTTLRFDPAIVPGPNGKQFSYQVQVNGTVGDLLTNEVVVTSDGFVGEVTAVFNTLIEYRRYFPFVGR